MSAPSRNRANGRDSKGRFGAGTAGGPGNPYAKRVAEMRAALLDAVGVEDLKAVVAALVEKAKQGDVPAAREVLERVLGKAEAIDVLARLEELEERVAKAAETHSLGRR